VADSLRYFGEVLRLFPLAVLGFVFLGIFAALLVHLQFKMREIGYRTTPLFTQPSDWRLPAKYLSVCRQPGWLPWPAYALWPCLIAGILLLAIGLF
jgi:hypothetical protein